jgi:hypothetical protein
MLSTIRQSIIIALAALAALSTVGATAQANTNHHSTSVSHSAAKKPTKSKGAPRNSYASLANYTAGFMTKGNNVPQGGNRYEPGFAGWANFAKGYKASHPADFPG